MAVVALSYSFKIRWLETGMLFEFYGTEGNGEKRREWSDQALTVDDDGVFCFVEFICGAQIRCVQKQSDK